MMLLNLNSHNGMVFNRDIRATDVYCGDIFNLQKRNFMGYLSGNNYNKCLFTIFIDL